MLPKTEFNALCVIVFTTSFFIGHTLQHHVLKEASLSYKVESSLSKKKVYKTERLSLSSDEFYCLAKNIYHEAGVESHYGKLAVAQITHNRIQKGIWGNSFCQVVYSYAQFSWTLFQEKREETPRGPVWRASIKAAQSFVAGTRLVELDHSLHYHAVYVKPEWSKTMDAIAVIGKHIFYFG